MRAISVVVLALWANTIAVGVCRADDKVVLFADSKGNIAIGTAKNTADAQVEISGGLLVAPKTTNLSTVPPALVSVNAVYLLTQNGGFPSADRASVACVADGGRLATYDELVAAFNNGAAWCQYGWIVANANGSEFAYPNQVSSPGCNARGVVSNWGAGPVMANCVKTVALQVSGDVRIDGHVTTVAPVLDGHAATKAYVDTSTAAGTSAVQALTARVNQLECQMRHTC